MKTLTVVIRSEFSIPDDWQLVEHSAGVQALQIGDRFVSFDVVPIETQSKHSSAEWRDADDELVESIVDTVVTSASVLEISSRH